jgi:glycosyltransferase involved in cell wall biosynthesis
MRVAFIHDWLNGMRGGERVLEALCREFPDAPIYTLLHEPGRVSPAIEAHPITTSWFQRLPGPLRRRYRHLLPLMPRAAASLRPGHVDLVISLSHCVAKGATVPESVPHLCYCFSPMRYIWDQFDQYIGAHTGRRWMKPLVRAFTPGLRQWDVKTAQRATEIIAISEHIAQKTERFWGRRAGVIYPPVDTDHFTPDGQPPGDHFFLCSAMVPYKRVDLVVEAANRSGFPLRIAGEGPEYSSIARMAGPTVTLLGRISDDALRGEYRRARALLFPGEEDFGITPLEAHACGRPVIALRRGGVRESVVEGETGLFFDQQSPEALIEAVRRFGERAWDLDRCRARAEEFSLTRFRREFREAAERLL